MKLAYLAFSAASLLGVEAALACSPPPDATYVQFPQVSTIADSHEVSQALRAAGGTDLASITVSDRGYVVASSNGAFVEVRVTYDQPVSNGMCPQISGVEILDSGSAQQ